MPNTNWKETWRNDWRGYLESLAKKINEIQHDLKKHSRNKKFDLLNIKNQLNSLSNDLRGEIAKNAVNLLITRVEKIIINLNDDITRDELLDYFDNSEEINDKFESLRVSINSFSKYASNKNNQIGIDLANELNEKIRLLSSHGSSLTALDKEIINQMKSIIIDNYKELGPTANGIGYFHTLLRNISLCLSYLSALISRSQCDDIDQKAVAVGQINTTFFARSTRQEKAVKIDEELNKLIENHAKSGT